MATIRVIPSLLLEAANELQRISTEIEEVGGQVQTAASRAPSYEGQFGPKVQSLGAEAKARGCKLVQDLSALAEELRSKGEGFRSADLIWAEGLAGILARFETWLSSERLLPMNNIPIVFLSRLFTLSTLFSIVGGRPPDDKPDWKPQWWAPTAIDGYELWSRFDESIGQSIRNFSDDLALRVKQGAEGIAWAFYFTNTQGSESQMATWINDYILAVQKPGLPQDGPLTKAFEAMMMVNSTGEPASLIGAELVELMRDRQVNVAFILPGGGASTWEGQIILGEKLVDSTKLNSPGNAALVGHELTHELQRSLDDPYYWPKGTIKLEEPSRGIVGDSTNYMEVLAYIVGDTIEYDLLLQKSSIVALSVYENQRLVDIQNNLATLTDLDAWSAAQSIAISSQDCDVYLDNFVIEYALQDHRIPPGGWEHWLGELGFSDASIDHIKSIAAKGSPNPLEALDPNTGKIITATPTPLVTPSPISTPPPQSTSVPASSVGSSPTPDPPLTSTEKPANEP